jgi:hypothetical protein
MVLVKTSYRIGHNYLSCGLTFFTDSQMKWHSSRVRSWTDKNQSDDL